MKYFTKKIIAVLLTVMLTGITVLHVSGGQTIKVNAAQIFKVHFIDVGARRWSFASIWRRRKREVCPD